MVKVLNITELKETINTISPIQLDYFAESCAVSLEHQGKAIGVQLEVDGDTKTKFELNWSSPSNKSGYKEGRKFAENGAVALSFLLAIELTEYQVIEESTIGTGFDYWLAYKDDNKNYNPLNFLNARLEISGINKETASNSIERRVKKKLKQINPTDNTGLPGYVSIVAFDTPKAFFKKK